MATTVMNAFGLGYFGDQDFYIIGNFSCDDYYLPRAIELFEGESIISE